jgi:hypothetical protein
MNRGDVRFARPADLCRDLLEALEATEGRRRRRKRNTTPDSIGIAIKRELLEAAAIDDPEPEAFEGWLVERCQAAGTGSGPYRAMALVILEEWNLARVADSFRGWLQSGAPSDDKADGGRVGAASSRVSPACRNGACGLALVLMALSGCGGEERALDERGETRLDLGTGAAAIEVADELRGEPARTIYDRPPELGLDSGQAAPGAVSAPDPTRRAGLSADSLARVGGRPPVPAQAAGARLPADTARAPARPDTARLPPEQDEPVPTDGDTLQVPAGGGTAGVPRPR